MFSHAARAPFPPFNCAVTGKNQPLIRQCYLIKTAPRLARPLITSNFEKDGGRGKTEDEGNVRSSNGELPRKRTDKLDAQRGGGGGGLACGSGAGG